jgi:hypothetical protein
MKGPLPPYDIGAPHSKSGREEEGKDQKFPSDQSLVVHGAMGAAAKKLSN